MIRARSLKTLSICLSLGVGIPVAGVLVFSPQTAQAAETGTISGVVTNAKSGERMPQKSTFFHPKLGTGLVFHPLTP